MSPLNPRPGETLKAILCADVFQRDSGDDEDMDKASEDEEGQLEEQIERLQEKVESAQSEQKNLFLVIFQVKVGLFVKRLHVGSCNMSVPHQRFIMLLTEHLVRCETGSVDISTPWYKNCIERLQQIFLMVTALSHTHTHTYLPTCPGWSLTFPFVPQHHVTIQQYMGTLENLLFTAELDHHILAVYQQFCALQL